jgi:hypothetical protein
VVRKVKIMAQGTFHAELVAVIRRFAFAHEKLTLEVARMATALEKLGPPKPATKFAVTATTEAALPLTEPPKEE